MTHLTGRRGDADVTRLTVGNDRQGVQCMKQFVITQSKLRSSGTLKTYPWKYVHSGSRCLGIFVVEGNVIGLKIMCMAER